MKFKTEVPFASAARPYRVEGTWLVAENGREKNELERLLENGALGNSVGWDTSGWALDFISSEAATAVSEELSDTTTA